MASSAFFADLPEGRAGLTLFLVAGDPELERMRELLLLMDSHKVDCLELAIPFPDSPTDGPVIRESADRAIDRGVGTDQVLELVAEVRPQLSHMKIALLADWSHSIKGEPLPGFMARVRDAGCDGLLAHGLPPLLRSQYYEAAAETGLPIVTTCYVTSEADVLAEAAEHGSAYIYLVAAYGRSGTVGPPDHSKLVPVLKQLRAGTDVPIAVGFGVKTRADIEGLAEVGADAAIVGSSCVKCVAEAQEAGRDVVEDFRDLLIELGAPPGAAADGGET